MDGESKGSLRMQPPIQDYALIGDCRSAALVSRTGSVDWLCWPHFDSPAIFGALLDSERGGAFAIGPTRPTPIDRRYRPETNVLETTFRGAAGTVRLTDLMPVWGAGGGDRLRPEHEVLRVVECLGGEMELQARYDPRPEFGRGRPVHRHRGALGHGLRAGKGLLVLRTDVDFGPDPRGGLAALWRMRRGEARFFSLTYSEEDPAVLPPLGAYSRAVAEWTATLWRDWARYAAYAGPWRSAVVRSALVLKLLSYAPSGAVVAAPTTSLPERTGGDLNWDYRYCWLRDASLTVRALFGLGYAAEARAFVSWLLHATRLTRPRLRVLYDVYGRNPRGEESLDGWSGYRGSRPVRVGNGARDQLQLDTYGEVIDATAQFVRRGGRVDRETARALIAFGDFVVRHWRDPDEGIWEVRSGRRAHTHSRALCWAAMDRLIELFDRGLLAGAFTVGGPACRCRWSRDSRRPVGLWSRAASRGALLLSGGRPHAGGERHHRQTRLRDHRH
jgi:GH15 family glucan-1,4-alpha-glucosidase